MRSPRSFQRRLSAFIGGFIGFVMIAGLSYVWLFGAQGGERQSTGKPSVLAPPQADFAAEHTHIGYTDVTQQAGLQFIHDAGARGDKWYPETIGAGGGFSIMTATDTWTSC